MILSFHPIFEGDKNILCAGREPGADDLAAVRAADAVILPQGCKASLYTMARENCANVFPNYDARFKYPGKIGQTRLFRELNAPHPKTEIYTSHSSFLTSHSSLPSFPFVFKFDWGGEGDNVFLIRSSEESEIILQKAAVFESTGQSGFLIQEYIPSQNRDLRKNVERVLNPFYREEEYIPSQNRELRKNVERVLNPFYREQEYIPSQNRDLRVAVIGQKMISYWRVQKDTEKFCSNLSKGAVIDSDSDPEIQAKAVAAVRWFCEKTGINLAGFDLLFSQDGEKTPLFIEINYFFGRQGLGGSERFYDILTQEIGKWINSL
jgi:ribosomal protein S6--L-glutamate ligase